MWRAGGDLNKRALQQRFLRIVVRHGQGPLMEKLSLMMLKSVMVDEAEMEIDK